jgi:hypothetical protein
VIDRLFLKNFVDFDAAFWKGWDMALVIVATMPFLVGVGMAVSVVTGRLKVIFNNA